MKQEQINRGNYEVFLLDYLEGKLSDPEQQQLLAFLEVNPDLKEEFEALSAFDMPVLSPSEDIFTHKAQLRKAVVLNEDECTYTEELSFKALEGDANLLELKEHHTLLVNDEVYRKNFSILKHTQQVIDPSVQYPYKSGLKKRTLIPLTAGQWMQFSSVAATLAVLLLAADLFFNEPANNDQLAEQKANTQIEEGNIQASQISAESQIETAQGEQSVPGKTEGKSFIAASMQAGKETANLTANQQVAKTILAEKAEWKAENATQNRSENVRNDLAALQTKQPRRLDPSLFTAEAKSTYASLLPAALPAISFYTEDAEPSQQAISLSDYLLLRFKRDILKLECDNPQNPELKLYEIADVGLQQINKVSKDRFKWEGHRDPNGNLTAYNLKTPLLEITKPEGASTSPKEAQ